MDKIEQLVPQHYVSYHFQSVIKTPTINPRVNKIIMTTNNKIIPLIYINGDYSYINEHLLKKLRAGDLATNISVIVVGVIVYVMCQLSGINPFTILR
jgi:hypothetical protein